MSYIYLPRGGIGKSMPVEAMEDLRGREFYRRLPMKQEALPREGKKLQAQSRGEMSP